MSRYSAEHKGKTRQKIIGQASKIFREKGYAGAGVQKLMKAAGLTQGGFYAHFSSKDDLLIEALKEAFQKNRDYWLLGTENLSPEEKLKTLLKRFISRDHRDDVTRGCPSTTLITEMNRSGKKIKKVFEEELLKSIRLIFDTIMNASHDKNRSNENDAEEKALALISISVGAIALSRAIQDPAMSDKLLHSARKAALSIIACP